MNEPASVTNTSEALRMRLQMESNLLTWVRTSIGLMGFGFVVARFGLFLRELAEANQQHILSHPRWLALNVFTGTVLILLGVVVMIISVLGHRGMVARFERGEFTPPTRWSLSVILSCIVVAIGMFIALYLTVVEF